MTGIYDLHKSFSTIESHSGIIRNSSSFISIEGGSIYIYIVTAWGFPKSLINSLLLYFSYWRWQWTIRLVSIYRSCPTDLFCHLWVSSFGRYHYRTSRISFCICMLTYTRLLLRHWVAFNYYLLTMYWFELTIVANLGKFISGRLSLVLMILTLLFYILFLVILDSGKYRDSLIKILNFSLIFLSK